MEALKVVAASWPIAMVLIAAMVGGVALYLIRWFKQSDLEDKALRASQAVVVRRHSDDAG